MVAPSSMATSKSCDMPIDSSRSWSAGTPSASRVSRSCAEATEPGPDLFEILGVRGQEHQPFDPDARKVTGAREGGSKLGLVEARLGGFVGQVHLDQDRQDDARG